MCSYQLIILGDLVIHITEIGQREWLIDKHVQEVRALIRQEQLDYKAKTSH